MLTTNEIKKQMELGNIIIKNTKEASFHKPNSVDVHLGNTLYVYDYQILDSRKSAEYLKELMEDKPKHLKKITIPDTGLLLEPYKLYLSKTIEEVASINFIPALNGKASLSLLGVSIELNSGYKWAGYKGALPLNIVATKPTIIYPDIPIGNLSFFISLNPSENLSDINGNFYGIYPSGMLSGSEIYQRMQGETPDILIDKQDKIKINPNSVNLTLNETIGVYTEPVLNIKEKNPYQNITIPDEGMWLYPDEVYLGRSNEWMHTNKYISMLSGRSSLGRLGLHVHCSAGMGSLGYQGYWHLGIRPTLPIKIIKDMECCQIYFYTPDGQITETYHGCFQDLPKDELGSQMHRILKKEK
jgi:dCTP deaminase